MPPILSTTPRSERMEEERLESETETEPVSPGADGACVPPPETMSWSGTQTQEALIADEFTKLNALYQAQLDQLVHQGVMLFSSATLRHNYHKNRYFNRFMIY